MVLELCTWTILTGIACFKIESGDVEDAPVSTDIMLHLEIAY